MLAAANASRKGTPPGKAFRVMIPDIRAETIPPTV